MSARRLLLTLMTVLALGAAGIVMPDGMPGAVSPAQAQVSLDFRVALSPYGVWRHHPRFGDVWVPRGVPRGWRPYEYGHWVLTDEWGWFWVSDAPEDEWGWIAFHYGRWVFQRGWGWFWVPGDEWAPAWVDWRYGGDYIGWAPLPPDELIDEYEEQPVYWVFVQPQYFIASRPRGHFLSSRQRASAWRGTHVVNRTFAAQGASVAVNPGVPAGFVASVTRRALPSYNVRPHVLTGTKGVAGAAAVAPTSHGRANAPAVQRASAAVAPSTSAAPPAALQKGQRGQLGSHPPRAAQTGAAPAAAPAAPATTPPPAAAPAAPAAPATTPPPAAAPAQRPQVRPGAPPPPPRPATPPPAAAPAAPKPQAAPPPATTAPPPAARPVAPPPAATSPRPATPPPVAHPAAPPPPRPSAPPPRPATPPPVAHPAPPPVAHPPPPPAARPAPPPPPPAVAHPPPPAAAHPPPPAAAKPPPKPGEKPEEEKK